MPHEYMDLSSQDRGRNSAVEFDSAQTDPIPLFCCLVSMKGEDKQSRSVSKELDHK